jgi:hypothetical protein
MPAAAPADVIVVAGGKRPLILRCVESVLECSGPALDRLIVITQAETDPALESLARANSRLILARQSDHPNEVEACNRGLAGRAGDTALLGASSIVSPGWLTELCEVAHSEERTAFAWPISNAGLGRAQRAAIGEDRALTGADSALWAVSGLPRCTTTSLVQGGCVYLRSEILDAIGLMDASFSARQSAILDWVMRAQALGFFGKRANHAYVQTAAGAAEEDDDRPAVLTERHPHLAYQVSSFRKSLDGNLARHAIDFIQTGKLRVAYDIRHIPREHPGARSYAVKLAKEVALLPQVELSLLVNTRDQADGLNLPIIKTEEWRDEFAVIHKPGQFLRREELEIPFGSSAHVVVTQEDLFARGGRGVCRDDDDLETHCAATSLSLLCASGILVHSESVRNLIASEYGIPGEEIAVLARGAEVDSRIAPARRRDRERLEPFLWEEEALATLEVYRAAVLRPSERSLQMRRSMHQAILSFASPSSTFSFIPEEPLGVRVAWRALNKALKRRIGRELRRNRPSHARTPA